MRACEGGAGEAMECFTFANGLQVFLAQEPDLMPISTFLAAIQESGGSCPAELGCRKPQYITECGLQVRRG